MGTNKRTRANRQRDNKQIKINTIQIQIIPGVWGYPVENLQGFDPCKYSGEKQKKINKTGVKQNKEIINKKIGEQSKQENTSK